MSLVKTALAAWKRMLRSDAIKNTGAFESKLVNSGVWNYDKEARGLLKGSLGKMRSAWGIPREKVKLDPKAYAEAYRSGVGLEHDRKFHGMLKANVTRQKNSPEFATKVKHLVRGNSLDIHPTYELGNSKKYIDSRFGGYKDFIDSDNKSHVLGIHGAITKHESHEGSAMFNRNSLLPRTLKADSISSAVKAPFNFLRKGRSDTARRGFATHFEPGVVFRESNDMMFLHPSVRIAERATRMMDGGATVYRGKLLNSKWNPKNWFSKPSTTSELDVLEKLHPGFRYGETHMSPKQIHKANQRYINKDF